MSISEFMRKFEEKHSGTHHVTMNIDDMAIEVHFGIIDHGFWEEFDATCELLAQQDSDLLDKYITDSKIGKLGLVMSEVSEAIEAVRKNSMDDKITDMKGEVVELADAVIRILDYCGKFNLCLGEAIAKKLAYNRTRPHKHGKLA